MKLIILVSVLIGVSFAEDNEVETSIFGRLKDVLNNYDVNIRPSFGSTPTNIKMSAYALQVGPYCEVYNDMCVDLYLRHYWNDPRLVIPIKSDEKHEELRLGRTFKRDAIWTPDTFFPNSRKVERNDGEYFVRIDPNGDITMSERLTVHARCNDGEKEWSMGETRTCKVMAESYAYNVTEVVYESKQGRSFGIGETLYPFKATNVTTAVETVRHDTIFTMAFDILKLEGRNSKHLQMC